MDLLEVGKGYGRRMGYHGNILLRTSRGRKGRDKKPNYVEWEGKRLRHKA